MKNLFFFLKKKVKYIICANLNTIQKEIEISNSKLDINEIIDPLNFNQVNPNKLNIFNINSGSNKFHNMISQLNICNYLCNKTKYDLVTMPINKSIFKQKSNFVGLTEYFGKINSTNTLMLMVGERFSILPITTHISLNEVCKNFKYKIDNFLKIFKKIDSNINLLENFDQLIILCINPHCGENGFLGNEEKALKSLTNKINFASKKLLPADSAFNNLTRNPLYISGYHDQALIPFKIMNKESFNLTLGLNYRRISPAHGTAKNIKNKNLADCTSYKRCMQI